MSHPLGCDRTGVIAGFATVTASERGPDARSTEAQALGPHLGLCRKTAATARRRERIDSVCAAARCAPWLQGRSAKESARPHDSLRMACEDHGLAWNDGWFAGAAPARSASLLPAPPLSLSCRGRRLALLQAQFAAHQSGSECGVEALRHSQSPSSIPRNVAFTCHARRPPLRAPSHGLDAASPEA